MIIISLLHTYIDIRMCVCICLFQSILHMETLLCIFFQYPFEIGWHFLLLLRVNAVYCAKSNTCLAFCRFRSRCRRAKYRLTCIYFLFSKDKRNKSDFLKIMSYPLLHLKCQIFYDLLFIMKIPWSSPSFFLQSPGYPRSSVLYLSWPWLARCDSSFCGWSECMCLTGWPKRRARCETINRFSRNPG